MKQIIGIEDLKDWYWIDRTGDVYKITYDRITGVKKIRKMAPYITKDDYVEYVLTRTDGSKKHIQAQRLVMLTYVGVHQDLDKIEVNHKDGNRQNNLLSNLQWVTKSQNIKHSFDKLGKVVHNKGKTKNKDGSYS